MPRCAAAGAAPTSTAGRPGASAGARRAGAALAVGVATAVAVAGAAARRQSAVAAASAAAMAIADSSADGGGGRRRRQPRRRRAVRHRAASSSGRRRRLVTRAHTRCVAAQTAAVAARPAQESTDAGRVGAPRAASADRRRADRRCAGSPRPAALTACLTPSSAHTAAVTSTRVDYAAFEGSRPSSSVRQGDARRRPAWPSRGAALRRPGCGTPTAVPRRARELIGAAVIG